VTCHPRSDTVPSAIIGRRGSDSGRGLDYDFDVTSVLLVIGYLQLCEQGREGELNGVSEDVAIDVEVGMHQPIAHANDLRPRETCQFQSTRIADLAGRFADDLDRAG